ncbi:MAG: DUF1549 domain-containing protein, partial [Planctomycetota bacterium]|nr:DUF1549 domain-containing protein [Planctomycetota bacterium]
MKLTRLAKLALLIPLVGILLAPLVGLDGSFAAEEKQPATDTKATKAETKPAPEISADDADYFEKHIRPVFIAHCVECHGDKKQEAGLRLDLRKLAMRGGDEGPVIRAGKPDESKLIAVLSHAGDIQMPPDNKMPPEAIAALTTWIERGAPWPESPAESQSEHSIADAAAKHWAFQPVRMPDLPNVKQRNWVQSPLDQFILAKLEEQGIAPSAPADRRTWLRRVSVDLTGLPPTLAEVEAFLNDASPDAEAKVVDRLLASPRYGERWGRHWLDLARYADTKGYVFQENRDYAYAYVYRDWVVQALNQDMPYDQFLTLQLAADRLISQNGAAAYDPSLAAMGFTTIGRRFLNSKFDIIDDRIDVVMRTTQGLTVACARCHDHKFDPIPTADYYSLFGVFDASEEQLQPLSTPSAEYQAELQAREAKVTDRLQREHQQIERVGRQSVGQYLLATAYDATKISRDSPLGKAMADSKEIDRLVERWKAFVERRTKSHHAILSPWNAFAVMSADQFATKSPELSKQFAENNNEAARINPRIAELFKGEAPQNLEELAGRFDKLFAEVDQQWGDLKKQDPKAIALADPAAEELRQFLYDEATPLNIAADETEKFLLRGPRNEVRRLRKLVIDWTGSKSAPRQAMTLVDASAIAPMTNIFIRGNTSRPGAPVPRQFLSVVAGEKRQPFQRGSGRLELARAITRQDNPLTARVMVNRVWKLHFGEGLVRTPSDFGLRSDPPSHPELLDYLASQFMRQGWSMKQLHRWIVLSATYRQNSVFRS